MAQRTSYGGHPGRVHFREHDRTRVYGMPIPNSSVISNASSQSSRSSSRSSHSSSSSSSDWSDSGYGSSSSSSSDSHRRKIHHHWHVHHRDSQPLGPPELIPYTPSSSTGTRVISGSSSRSPEIPRAHVSSESLHPLSSQGARHHIYHGRTTPANSCPTPALNGPRPDEMVEAFHPHLRQYYHPNPTDTSGFIHAPSLQWDIIYPPSTARFSLGRGMVQRPNYTGGACAPPTVRRIHLTSTHECLSYWMSPDRWGPIIIDDPRPPTVHRILERIHDYLRQPLTPWDMAAVLSTPINRTRLDEARRSRLNDTAGMQPYGGYLRSDVLGGHRRFFGCRMSIQDGIWRATVDFIPGPVPRLW